MGITKKKDLLFAGLVIVLALFESFVLFAASRETLKILGAYQIDKIAHFAAGVVIALALGRFSIRSRGQLLLMLVIITFGWEALEFFFNPETRLFFARAPGYWFIDSFFDILVAFAGAYGYVFFIENKEPARDLPPYQNS